MVKKIKVAKPDWRYRVNQVAQIFVPHQFRSEVVLTSGLPRVLLTRQAYNDMFILVDELSKEVGWIGSVEKLGRDYLIKEVFLLDQESHTTTCEITADGLSEWASEVLSSREDGMEVVNGLRFWGHSHVNMGTSPSAQDDTQMSIFSESCDDFFIRGILNKAGRMEFTLYLYELGVEIQDCQWAIHEPADNSRREKWQAEIAAKVRERIYHVPVRDYSGVNGYPYNLNGEEEYFASPVEKMAVVGCSEPLVPRKRGRRKG